MLYTLAEAAKATGLDESLIVSAIKDGQVTSVKDLSGEWRIEDEELHRLYLSIVQEYCRRKSQQEPRSDATTISEAHISGPPRGLFNKPGLTRPSAGHRTRAGREHKVGTGSQDKDR